MPGGIARTSTLALTNAMLPFILHLASSGWLKAMAENNNLLRGRNVHDGVIACPGGAATHSKRLVAAEMMLVGTGSFHAAAASVRRWQAGCGKQRPIRPGERAMSNLAPRAGGVRIGVDVGGTFTDVVLCDPDGRMFINKTTTTPQDPGEGVVAGIVAVLAEAGVAGQDVVEIVHGTTVALQHHPAARGRQDRPDYHPRLPRRAGNRPHPACPACST